jgi:hypothetical protein
MADFYEKLPAIICLPRLLAKIMSNEKRKEKVVGRVALLEGGPGFLRAELI